MKSKSSVSYALKLLNSNKLIEGRKVLDQILLDTPTNIDAHQLMVKLGFISKDFNLAEKYLTALIEFQPMSEHYIKLLVDLYSHQNRWKDISVLQLGLARKQPENATIQFNCAYYLKLSGEFNNAITFYKKALELGIDDDYEIYLNIAIIYSEHLSMPERAIEILTLGINKYPDQDLLLYNLGNIYEQLGNKEQAKSMFKLSFSKNPKNYDALARQADIYKFKTKDDDLISKMESVFKSSTVDAIDKINIAYALGKSYDDCTEYSLASQYYQLANEFDQKTLPLYDPVKYEQYIDNTINVFNKNWFDSFEAPTLTSLSKPPIFICGMFRSGSTLCEQILAAHSHISNGGEQEFFHRSMSCNYPNYPFNTSDHFSENKKQLLKAYEDEIKKHHKTGVQLTDKRPDNFLYLGLIKALMPNAKIIWTQRNMLDNCLSVYFLRLGKSMPYSTKIENIVHFYKQQEKLMNHWNSLFSDDIHQFIYDELINSPEEHIRGMLNFLDLPWQNECLHFHEVKNQVKTASVWQVRQPLYKSSSQRWKNYETIIEKFI
ncbi:hypothetical protein A3Q34_12745 [Colwellia sp. PAMC 20917]|uniref:tetratricopeptide repeat-containing sulfotransferase family protein n=1 Tax=Colwellia sp. PAMC 20917 TaxID=1816218 RepID=UPI00087803F5|nr:tetratricopeptide repeat-containing sulfotransferase family protein [Colwellia sp. PAMC 20917]AOW77641.1 hypothetical protein A3Q34_12745 [Colwellia sp. PAMC 20917]